MLEIALAAVANQQFSVQIDATRYDITLQEANGCMAATIVRDSVTLVSAFRVVAGEPLIPYAYLTDGNFAIVTDGDALPYWTEFGTTQYMLYVTADEAASLLGT